MTKDIEAADETVKKKRRGRPKGSTRKFDAEESRILKYKPDDLLGDKIISKYSGPSDMTIMYLELLYYGAVRKEAYITAKKFFGKEIPSDEVMGEARCVLLNHPRSIAYLQLLVEGIIDPIINTLDFPSLEFNIDNFKKINLMKNSATKEQTTLINFYRRVICRKIIKKELTVTEEMEALNSNLARKTAGSSEDLKRLLWKQISDPYKRSDARIIQQYMDLCNMNNKNSIQDTNINITFKDFDNKQKVVIEEETK